MLKSLMKQSVVNENLYDNLKVQKYKQELNRSDLWRLTGVFLKLTEVSF